MPSASDIAKAIQEETANIIKTVNENSQAVKNREQMDMYRQSHLSTIDSFNLVLWLVFFFFYFVLAFMYYMRPPPGMSFRQKVIFFLLLLLLPFAHMILNMCFDFYRYMTN
jgi:uncharacterized membrane protein YgcG